MSKGMSGHEKPNKGATDVWLTPLSIIEQLNQDFDVDPCGEDHWPTAKTIFTERGLQQPWLGNVWCNPPYSEVGKWLDKMAEHSWGTALVFARTDTKWAQKHMKLADSVFFLKGRIKFHKKDGSLSGNAGAPSMFLTYGYEIDFTALGFEGWQAK